MAQRRQKDILNRLADAGEEAFSRVAGSPATARLVDTVSGMRERLDDVQKRVRGLDELERRVKKLEKRVDELSKPKTTRARTTSGTTARRRTPGGTSGRSTPRTRKKPESP